MFGTHPFDAFLAKPYTVSELMKKINGSFAETAEL